MSLATAMRLPFQTASLLFVAMITAFNAVAGGAPELKPMRLMVIFILLSWLNKYAFALLELAANGAREAPTASVEMLSPLGDARAWIHPTLAAAILLGVTLVGTTAAYVAAALLALAMPASLIALVVSPRLRDALNPLLIARLMRDLGPWYLALLAAAAAVVALCLALYGASGPQFLRFATAQFAVLALHAFIGGLVHHRRLELGFEAQCSPEREADRREQAEAQRRQHAMDEFYGAIRARDTKLAQAALTGWFAASTGNRLVIEVEQAIDQSSRWPDGRGLATLVRAIVARGIETRQPGLVVLALEHGLRHQPALALADVETVVAAVGHARQAGRRRLAAALIDNFRHSAPGTLLPPELEQLRADLPT